MRRIGVLMNLAADDPNLQVRIAAFEADLQESSWIVGRNTSLLDTIWFQGRGK
jgi:putative tryptophan/tyrosine transport system substrate-binding protein